MYYYETGKKNGQLVVFIHGGYTDGSYFIHQKNILSDKHCIFPDMPGYGKSKGLFSYRLSALKIVKLIKKLNGDKKVIIIAHSFGGLIAKRVIEMIPDEIEKVVICSTNLRRDFNFIKYTTKIGYKNTPLKRKWIVIPTQLGAWFSYKKIKKSVGGIKGLFMYAQYDLLVVKQSMENEWRKFIPDSQMEYIEGTGHNFMVTKYELVNKKIKEFLYD